MVHDEFRCVFDFFSIAKNVYRILHIVGVDRNERSTLDHQICFLHRLGLALLWWWHRKSGVVNVRFLLSVATTAFKDDEEACTDIVELYDSKAVWDSGFVVANAKLV